MPKKTYDLLIIGAGPAGASAAYWAAKAGLETLAVEKKVFPREKTCGDGLTPRAVKELTDMGLAAEFSSWHRHKGLRTRAHGKTLELEWPTHPVYPSYGLCVRRRELDEIVVNRARQAGAEIVYGTEALRPVMEDGKLAGAELAVGEKLDEGDVGTANASSQKASTAKTSTVRARYVLVAEGANSRFGRALGTKRDRSLPQGMAIRTYFASPVHDDPWIESALDICDRQGNTLPGYGWIFPLGDGSVNVGIGLLSTFRDYKSVNTSWLMEEWAHAVPDFWGLDPAAPEIAPVGGRLPMGGSVSPKVGQNWLVAGDAAGTVNPFNGEGIDYAYETGRAAADAVARAIAEGDSRHLSGYADWLEETYGLYFKVGQLFAKAIGNPQLIRRLTQVGMHSATLMEWVLRIMANILRPDERKPAELAYAAAKNLVKLSGD